MTKPDHAVCIHGHFYQPPRENPWREEIEPQDSASPFHDWNERISHESYAPCTRARLLDAEGRVRRVMNAFSRMSFNMGPTLLSWMEDVDPVTYRAILDADRESSSRFSGHATAIAQAYSHAILPLATRRDKLTQVRWGIRDFERRFGRKPEALWLPETAVDVETLEVLALEGMRYVLLAPHQIARVRPVGSVAWRAADAAMLDTTVSYLVRLPSGRSIAAFPYNGALAHGVSFGNFLENGDRFLAHLLSALPRDGGLVHLVTDGETYGHHHRFGEMALAYVLEHLEVRDDMRLTNYGEWLDDHPPLHEAEISPNTSWSCPHGVERWRSDCGCTTYRKPGWNQAWRLPLRRAVDELNGRLDDVYESQGRRLFRDPWAARDEYIDVILHPTATDTFLEAQSVQPLPPSERTEALRLLEMQRHRLLAATSCGWYFDDLAGLETVQILRYAARAIELAEGLGERGVESAFLAQLALAKSNEPALGDGRQVYERLARSAALDPLGAVKERVVSALYADRAPTDAPPKPARGVAVEALEETERRAGANRLIAGRARTRIYRTREEADVLFAGIWKGSRAVCVGAAMAPHAESVETILRRFEDDGPDAAASAVADAFPPPVRVAETLSPRDLADLERSAANATLLSMGNDGALATLLSDPRARAFGELHGLAVFALHESLIIQAQSLDSLEAIGRLLDRAEVLALPVARAVLAHALARTIARVVARWDSLGVTSMSLDRAARGALYARSLDPGVNLWQAQEAYLDAVERERATSRELPSGFAELGDALGVRAAAVVQRG